MTARLLKRKLSLMKRLILIRHAKSSQEDSSLSDRARPLNARGVADAPRMGIALSEFRPLPEAIFTSVAVRAETTARLIAEKLGFDMEAIVAQESLYTFDDRELLSAIRAFPDQDTCVALVGHNPACHSLFEQLLGQRLDKYVTCGSAIIDFDATSWRQIVARSGTLVQFLSPKQLS